MTTELAIREGQTAFDAKQVAALEQIGVDGASRADQAIFFHQCVRTGLDPFARQIYMIGRNSWDEKKKQWGTKQTIQTGIDGFRLIARRAVSRTRETLGYADPLWCGPDGRWVDVWLETEPPRAAKVTVFRDGEPFPAVALLTEYQGTKKDGTRTQQWMIRPAHMLAKCAEALALRMAFPQDLSGIYTTDELGTAVPDADAAAVTVVTREEAAPMATRRMSRANRTDQQAITATEAPLPAIESAAPEPITDAQLTKLMATFNDIGIRDRQPRLDYCIGVIGHDIASSKELTKAEASAIIDDIERALSDSGEPS